MILVRQVFISGEPGDVDEYLGAARELSVS